MKLRIPMTKKTACHKLADINEEIYDLENRLSDIRSRLIWDADDLKRKLWYQMREKEVSKALDKAKREHDEFIKDYSDILYG